MVEQFEDPPLDPLAHHVLPAAGLLVDVGPVEADHVGQQALGEAVLAHDFDGAFPACFRQLKVPVAGNDDEAVALHPADGLGDGGAGVAEPFGDPGAEGDDVFFFKFQNGPKIHLGGIDQIRHSAQLLERRPCVIPTVPRAGCALARSAVRSQDSLAYFELLRIIFSAARLSRRRPRPASQ